MLFGSQFAFFFSLRRSFAFILIKIKKFYFQALHSRPENKKTFLYKNFKISILYFYMIFSYFLKYLLKIQITSVTKPIRFSTISTSYGHSLLAVFALTLTLNIYIILVMPVAISLTYIFYILLVITLSKFVFYNIVS